MSAEITISFFDSEKKTVRLLVEKEINGTVYCWADHFNGDMPINKALDAFMRCAEAALQRAAEKAKAELEGEMIEAIDKNKIVLEWLANGDTGISSESLAFQFLGFKYGDSHPPRDPAGLNRCLMLIEKVPEIRKCVDELALVNDSWAKAAKVWDQITKCFIEEIGIGWPDCKKPAKLTYKLMKNAGL